MGNEEYYRNEAYRLFYLWESQNEQIAALKADVERLRKENYFLYPEKCTFCGAGTKKCDEDGCCLSCGVDIRLDGAVISLQEQIAALKDENEKFKGALKNIYFFANTQPHAIKLAGEALKND